MQSDEFEDKHIPVKLALQSTPKTYPSPPNFFPPTHHFLPVIRTLNIKATFLENLYMYNTVFSTIRTMLHNSSLGLIHLV